MPESPTFSLTRTFRRSAVSGATAALMTQSSQRPSRYTRSGRARRPDRRRGTCRSAAGCARACDRARRRRSRWRAGSRRRPPRRPSSAKSIVPTTSERLAGSATKGVVYSAPSAQPYRCPEDSRVRATHPSSPPPSSIQRIWSASRNRVATAGVLYVWSLSEFSSAVSERQERGNPALGGGKLGDPLLRGGAEQRDPQAAVAGEGLLRGEVVGVRVGEAHRQTAGARGRVDQHQRVAASRQAAARGPSLRWRSRCAPRSPRRPARSGAPSARRIGSVAGVGGDDDGVLQERRAGGDGGELGGELAVGEVQRAALDQAEGGGVPEGGGAAVAQRDLIAVGQREQLAQAGADLRRRAP